MVGSIVAGDDNNVVASRVLFMLNHFTFAGTDSGSNVVSDEFPFFSGSRVDGVDPCLIDFSVGRSLDDLALHGIQGPDHDSNIVRSVGHVEVRVLDDYQGATSFLARK